MKPFRSLVAAIACVSLAACASTDNSGDDGAPATPGLVIEPSQIDVTVVNDRSVEQPLVVFVVSDNGDRRDVTASASFEIAGERVGSMRDAVFVSGTVAGRATVRVTAGDTFGEAPVTVRTDYSSVDGSAPADAADQFERATPAAGDVQLLYPPHDVALPPNLGELEVHWQGEQATTLHEISIATELATIRRYTAGRAEDGGYIERLDGPDWGRIAAAALGKTAKLTVRSLLAADPTRAVTSSPVAVRLEPGPVVGGIYYWASTTADGAPAGIYRRDWGAKGDAEPFYTTDQSAQNRCVGCHALSRDGQRMAVTLDGGAGAGTLLDVATRQVSLAADAGTRWTHTAWTSDGGYLVSELDGRLALRVGATGAQVADVPTAPGYATYPDFSPASDSLVYGTRDPNQVVVQEFDATTGDFGPPRVLDAGPVKDSYPAWSPDGRWILYNQDGPGGNELWVVRADGSQPPIHLARADASADLHNAWPRWTPFEHRGADGEALYWFTFSSTRAFGLTLARDERTQLWMAAFRPARAESGADPSDPAFRIPFQDLGGTNHIAQWTERVVID